MPLSPPRSLRAPARVAIVSPAGRHDPERLAVGMDWLKGWGFDAVRYDDHLTPDRYLAGDDAARLDHLVRALTDPDVDAVWALRGGYGVTRILPQIPWDQVRPVPLIGFSDLTPLLDAHARHTGGCAWHAPVVHQLGALEDTAREHLRRALAAEMEEAVVGRAVVQGTVTAPMVGGNLALLAATCGTPFQLDARGAILLLEDVGEPAYRIDRMLVQLAQAGVLDGIVGVALGTFTDRDGTHSDGMDEVLHRAFVPQGVPIVDHLPIGHTADNFAVPIRARVTLSDDTLVWDDPRPDRTASRAADPQSTGRP